MNGIIFDFNGTMFFDEKFQEQSWKIFLEEKLRRSVTDSEFQEYVHGRNMQETLSYFWEKDLTPEETLVLSEEKEKIYRELCLKSKDFHLAKGLELFLDKIIQFNIPMTIATASGLKNVQFFFQYLHLDKWFDFNKVTYNDGTIKGKPKPDIFLNAAKKINVNIENCVIFEDSKSGIEAAKLACAHKIVGVASMQSSRLLIKYGATDIIENYTDINKLIYKIIL